MARRWVQGSYRRNNYQHEIRAKIGTHAYTVIYVTLETARLKSAGKLKPGDRIKWRAEPNINYDLQTGIVSDKTLPGGPLFIDRQ